MAESRGSRLIVPATVLSAGVLIAVWFPFSTLLNQSGQLSAANQQISTIQQESRSLAAQQRALSTTQAETLLAREEYQLVAPGQRLIQILNTSSQNGLSTGDPGNQPLVSPTNAAGLLPDNPIAPQTLSKHSSGFWSRVLGTLEFWK